ncbi:UNKNOWN [Stylonychia lemnae]|uniref:Uncharacterized protein n=1 Tax=Stylonychia lemnae TaxID=5949 RepID=A0A078B966_STYLE|nr:UNKNOWN [Stylonychia lemnae]|eukprot:CDW90919.1 UNKNOWN [Stylonychia lemnae]
MNSRLFFLLINNPSFQSIILLLAILFINYCKTKNVCLNQKSRIFGVEEHDKSVEFFQAYQLHKTSSYFVVGLLSDENNQTNKAKQVFYAGFDDQMNKKFSKQTDVFLNNTLQLSNLLKLANDESCIDVMDVNFKCLQKIDVSNGELVTSFCLTDDSSYSMTAFSKDINTTYLDINSDNAHSIGIHYRFQDRVTVFKYSFYAASYFFYLIEYSFLPSQVLLLYVINESTYIVKMDDQVTKVLNILDLSSLLSKAQFLEVSDDSESKQPLKGMVAGFIQGNNYKFKQGLLLDLPKPYYIENFQTISIQVSTGFLNIARLLVDKQRLTWHGFDTITFKNGSNNINLIDFDLIENKVQILDLVERFILMPQSLLSSYNYTIGNQQLEIPIKGCLYKYKCDDIQVKHKLKLVSGLKGKQFYTYDEINGSLIIQTKDESLQGTYSFLLTCSIYDGLQNQTQFKLKLENSIKIIEKTSNSSINIEKVANNSGVRNVQNLPPRFYNIPQDATLVLGVDKIIRLPKYYDPNPGDKVNIYIIDESKKQQQYFYVNNKRDIQIDKNFNRTGKIQLQIILEDNNPQLPLRSLYSMELTFLPAITMQYCGEIIKVQDNHNKLEYPQDEKLWLSSITPYGTFRLYFERRLNDTDKKNIMVNIKNYIQIHFTGSTQQLNFTLIEIDNNQLRIQVIFEKTRYTSLLNTNMPGNILYIYQLIERTLKFDVDSVDDSNFRNIYQLTSYLGAQNSQFLNFGCETRFFILNFAYMSFFVGKRLTNLIDYLILGLPFRFIYEYYLPISLFTTINVLAIKNHSHPSLIFSDLIALTLFMKPFQDHIENQKEIFYETMTFAIAIFQICFTDYVQDQRIKDDIGGIMISIIVFFIAISLIEMGYDIAQMMKTIFKMKLKSIYNEHRLLVHEKK